VEPAALNEVTSASDMNAKMAAVDVVAVAFELALGAAGRVAVRLQVSPALSMHTVGLQSLAGNMRSESEFEVVAAPSDMIVV